MSNNDLSATQHPTHELRKLSASSAQVTIVAQGAKLLVQVISIATLARLLHPTDFGLVAMVAIFTNLVTVFKDGGLSMATIQHKDITHEQISNLFWINSLFGLALTLATVIASPLIASIYSEPRLIAVGAAIGCTFAISGIAVQHEALLRRQMRFKAIAAAEVFAITTGTLVATFAAWAGASYWALIILPLSVSVLQTFMYWTLCRWRPGKFSRGTGSRAMLNFGANLSAANIIGYLSSNITPFVVGLVGGGLQLGLYNRAITLTSLPSSQLLIPVMSVAQPALARIKEDQEQFKSAALSLLRKISLVSVFLAICIQLMADWIISAFLGPNWGDATPYLHALAVFAVIEPIAAAIAMIMIANGDTSDLLKAKMISLVLVTAAVPAGIYWGALGIVVAFATTGLVIRTPVFIAMACRSLPFSQRDLYRELAPVFFAGCVASACISITRSIITDLDPINGMLLFVPATTIVYVLACMAAKNTRAECMQLLTILARMTERMTSK